MGCICTKDSSDTSQGLIKDLIVPLEEIKFGDLINSGGCGQVFEGVYQDKLVAIKYGKLGQKSHKTVLSEIEAMHTFNHPNIIKLYAVAESENGFYLIMERGVKNLDQWIRSGNSIFNIKYTSLGIDTLTVIKSIVSALSYMHSFDPPYIHRDIKPSNILVMSDGSVKLSDFGLSTHEYTVGRHMSDVGTPSFTAPEVATHNYDERVDIYSLGLLIYFLISGGQYRAEDHQNGDIFRMNFISKTLYLLYKQCTALNPTERPSLNDIQLRLNKLIKYSKKSSSTNLLNRKFKATATSYNSNSHCAPVLTTGISSSSSGNEILPKYPSTSGFSYSSSRNGTGSAHELRVFSIGEKNGIYRDRNSQEEEEHVYNQLN